MVMTGLRKLKLIELTRERKPRRSGISLKTPRSYATVEFREGGLKPLIIRLVIFSALFILLSGIIGPWVIGTKLLYGFYFYLYGNLGKLVLFSSLAFFILARERLQKIVVPKYKVGNILFVVAGFVLVPLFFHVGKQLLLLKSFFSNIALSLSAHFLVIASSILIGLGVFTPKFVIFFIKRFKRQLLICLIISLGFYLAIFQVWKLWPFLSYLVLQSNRFLFSLTFPSVSVIPPYTLVVQNFAASIMQACSGVDSIFLFSSLYILIAIFEWKKLNHQKLIILFFPALFGSFLVNIFRVYLLFLVGVLISPKLALMFFHTYLGMLLFIIYFVIFWMSLYKWMKKKS